jgi:hypothetical protein
MFRDNAEAGLLTALESLTYASSVSLRRADINVQDAEREIDDQPAGRADAARAERDLRSGKAHRILQRRIRK